MADADDQHRQLCIMHFVYNTIRTDANAVQSGIFPLEHAAGCRVCFELINRFDNAEPIFIGYFLMT